MPNNFWRDMFWMAIIGAVLIFFCVMAPDAGNSMPQLPL
jgi:hypothetical protein